MLPHTFTWVPLLHLPSVPDHFVDLAFDKIKNPPVDNKNFTLKITTPEYMQRQIVQNGKKINSRCQVNYDMGQEWADWVRNNIFAKFQETGLRVSTGIDTTTGGPHVDNPGKIRLFYLIDRGGDQAETVWYINPGQPVVFDADSWTKDYPYSHDNIDELTVLERAQFPMNTWILFNGYILHGVNHVTGSRANFNVSIRPEDFQIDIRPRNKQIGPGSIKDST
jgi:hypothetical protein